MFRQIGFDLKRSTSKTAIVLLVIFILSALSLNNSGIKKIKAAEKEKKDFIYNESKKVESYKSYRQYGNIGFKLLFYPNAIKSMFSDNVGILQSSSDTGYKFDIENPKKGYHVFKGGNDFSWYLIFIGSIAVSLYGFGTFRNIEFIKYMKSYSDGSNVYINTLISKAIIITISMIILTLCIIGQFYFHNLAFDIMNLKYLIVNMLASLVVMIFFLCLGAALGNITNKSFSWTALFLLWFIFVFWVPNTVTSYISDKAIRIMDSVFSIEAKKVELITEFEQKRMDYIKNQEDKIKATKEYTENFLNDGEIIKLELDILAETKKKVNNLNYLSTISPVTFYKSVSNEISSIGYNEQIRFYSQSIKNKIRFVSFCLDKIFNNNTGKVTPFLSGDEYIFYAKPSFPAHLGLGIVIQLLWIVVIIAAGMQFHRRNMGINQERAVDFDKVELDIRTGKYISLEAEKPDYLAEQLLSYLTSKSKRSFTGKITLDGSKIESPLHVFYLPETDKLPEDIKVSHLEKMAGLKVSTNELFNKLTKIQKAELYIKLAATSKADIVFIPDLIFIQFEKEKRIKIADMLRKLKGKTVIEIIQMNDANALPHHNFDYYAHFFWKEEGYKMKVIKKYMEEGHKND